MPRSGWRGGLGRKVGEGFYRYVDGVALVPAVAKLPPVWIPARAARRAELLQLLKDLGATIETGAQPSQRAPIVVASLGHDVTTVAAVQQLEPGRTVGIDMLLPDGAVKRRVLATNPATRSDMRAAAHALFARIGKAVSVMSAVTSSAFVDCVGVDQWTGDARTRARARPRRSPPPSRLYTQHPLNDIFGNETQHPQG